MRNRAKIEAILDKEASQYSDTKLLTTSDQLQFRDVVAAAFAQLQLEIDSDIIEKAHQYVKSITENNEAVYGITTSFGGNIKNVVPSSQTNLLQHNLVTTHVTNVGTALPYEFCKASMLLRLMTISKGYSGVSLDLVQFMKKFLEIGLVPVIRAHGSMGASGDLGPLSAIAFAIMGQGEVYLPDRKTVMSTEQALAKYDLKPFTFTYREGLALINGTCVMTSVASFYITYLERIIENSLAIAALSVQALRSSKEPFDSRLHRLKPHKFQIRVASLMSHVLEGSKLAKSHKELKEEVEEALRAGATSLRSKSDLQGGSYSLRAIPQIYQPILALHKLFQEHVNTEINAVDDNPLLLPDEHEELHGANFHGHPISVTADSLNLAVITLANAANSRIDRLLKSHHSDLPAFLATGQEGLYLGMQGVQYTAAGICAELRSLAYPLSVNQVVTNNDNQDIVSFGLQASLKGIEITSLLAYVLAVESLAAVQGLWLHFHHNNHQIEELSPATRNIYERLLDVYTPQANTDQALLSPLESLADIMLLEHLLPEDARRELWID